MTGLIRVENILKLTGRRVSWIVVIFYPTYSWREYLTPSPFGISLVRCSCRFRKAAWWNISTTLFFLSIRLINHKFFIRFQIVFQSFVVNVAIDISCNKVQKQTSQRIDSCGKMDSHIKSEGDQSFVVARSQDIRNGKRT